ncbi:MAG: LuxR C-terminal-related transcriptional regulator [Brevinematales bacterium]
MKIEDLSLEPFSTRDIIPEVLNLKVKKIPLRWCIKKDGNPIPVAVTFGSYKWQGRKLICAIYRDLTNYLNDNIIRVNLISKITQLHGDLSDFIKILKYVDNPSVSFQNYGISEREQEVIKQIAKGLGNKEIAKKINVSEITVKKHVSSIFQKLKIKKRTELISFILDNNIKITLS